MLVFNNKPSDAQVLRRFKEPSWNNPVVRFLDAETGDVIERKDRVWDIQPMAARMVDALTAAKQGVPRYLRDMALETARLEHATFAMHCYWVGEAKLGSLDGVRGTSSGWVGGLEVVELTYDPDVTGYAKLLETAASFECASKVFAHNRKQLRIAKAAVGPNAVMISKRMRKAKLSDQKHNLRNTPGVRSLPLTRFQSTKINGLIDGEYENLLSPRQRKLLSRVNQYMRPESAKSFDGFVFPDDDSRLASYHARLLEHLNAAKRPLLIRKTK